MRSRLRVILFASGLVLMWTSPGTADVARASRDAGEPAGSPHTQELRQIIERFKSADSFHGYVDRLRKMTTEEDLPFLHGAIRNHPYPRAREAMTWVLAHICSEASLDALPEALSKEDYWKVRRNTTFALGEIGAAELQTLVAPIALYPDALLAHVPMASTAGLDVAATWYCADRGRCGDLLPRGNHSGAPAIQCGFPDHAIVGPAPPSHLCIPTVQPGCSVWLSSQGVRWQLAEAFFVSASEIAEVPETPPQRLGCHRGRAVSRRPQGLPHPMKPESGQVRHRGDPQHLLESVLQAPLTHPGRRAQVGHTKALSGLRKGMILGDLHDPTVSLPCQFSRRELNFGG